jgi:hypothetical protein
MAWCHHDLVVMVTGVGVVAVKTVSNGGKHRLVAPSTSRKIHKVYVENATLPSHVDDLMCRVST